MLKSYKALGRVRWHERFFRVSPRSAWLVWNKSEATVDDAKSSHLVLTAIHAVEAVNRSQVSGAPQGGFAFRVRSHQRTLDLLASSAEERRRWIEALQYVIAHQREAKAALWSQK